MFKEHKERPVYKALKVLLELKVYKAQQVFKVFKEHKVL